MRKLGNILWGVVLIVIGVILTLNALEITEYAYLTLFAKTVFCHLPIRTGSVIAITTPIIPSVISTSDNVNAFLVIIFSLMSLSATVTDSNIS